MTDEFPRQTLERLIDAAERRFEENQERGEGENAWRQLHPSDALEQSSRNIAEVERAIVLRHDDEWNEAGDALNYLLFALDASERREEIEPIQ